MFHIGSSRVVPRIFLLEDEWMICWRKGEREMSSLTLLEEKERLESVWLHEMHLQELHECSSVCLFASREKEEMRICLTLHQAERSCCRCSSWWGWWWWLWCDDAPSATEAVRLLLEYQLPLFLRHLTFESCRRMDRLPLVSLSPLRSFSSTPHHVKQFIDYFSKVAVSSSSPSAFYSDPHLILMMVQSIGAEQLFCWRVWNMRMIIK